MHKINSKFLPFLFVCIVLTLLFINISFNEYLDHDEAGQFWMAKGLWHHSLPFQTEGNLNDVMFQNSQHNLDPGGFTLLLHFWSKMSNNIIWLRLLPFIFFIGFVAYFFKTLILLLNDSKWILIGFAAMLLSNNFFYTFILIRPYSLEYFGALLLFYFSFRNNFQFTNKSLFFISILMGVFIWSRYTFSVNIVAWFVLYLYNNCQKESFHKSLLIAIPIIISLAFIYKFSILGQTANLKAPQNYHHALLYYNFTIRGILEHIYWNFINIRGLPYTLLLLTAIFRIRLKINLNPNIFHFIRWSLLIHATLAIYSIYGASPWHIRMPSSNYLILFNIISVPLLIDILLEKFNISIKNKLLNFSITIIVICLASTKVGYQASRTKDVILALNHPNPSIYYIEIPEVRYLYEYGGLKNKYADYTYHFKIIFNLDSIQNQDFPVITNKCGFSVNQKTFEKFNYTSLNATNPFRTYPNIEYVVLNSFK